MRIKQIIVVIEAVFVMVLASINTIHPISYDIIASELTTRMNISVESAALQENVEELEVEEEKEYVPSISDRIYHYDDIFEDVNLTGYVISTASLKARPYPFSSKVGTVAKYRTVTVTGVNEYNYYRVSVDGKTYYVSKDEVTTDYNVYQQTIWATYNTSWNGQRLSASAGTIIGPSGKETYYNLDMSIVVANMRRLCGNYDVYWVRSDGVKMLGDYVIIAAALDIRPRGSLVPTSLGMGIVCDTGGFALSNPTQIDIAVTW